MFQSDLFDAVPLDLVEDAESGIRYLPDVIPKAYSALEQLWSQRPFVTAAGVYLIDLARNAGVLGAVDGWGGG